MAGCGGSGAAINADQSGEQDALDRALQDNLGPPPAEWEEILKATREIGMPAELEDDLLEVLRMLNSGLFALDVVVQGTLDQRRALSYYMFGTYDNVVLCKMLIGLRYSNKQEQDERIEFLALQNGATWSYLGSGSSFWHAYALYWSADLSIDQLAEYADEFYQTYGDQVLTTSPDCFCYALE